MAAKSSLSHLERTRIEFLTSHLRSSSRLAVKVKYEAELAQILEGKDLTRGDMALAAYYFQNSGITPDSVDASQVFAQAYRDAPAE